MKMRTYNNSSVLAPPSVFIYNPEDPAPVNGNQFNNWAALMAAIGSIQSKPSGSAVIDLWFHSPSFSDITLPAGSWNQSGVKWNTTNGTTVHLANGCLLPGFAHAEGLNTWSIISHNQTTAPVGDGTADPGGFRQISLSGGVGLVQGGDATVPWLSGDTFYFITADRAAGLGDVTGISPSPVIDTSSGCFSLFFDGARLQEDAVGGSGFFGYGCNPGPRSGGKYDSGVNSIYFSTVHSQFDGFWNIENNLSLRHSMDFDQTANRYTIDADFEPKYNSFYKVKTDGADRTATLPSADKRWGEEILIKKLAGVNDLILEVPLKDSGTGDSFSKSGSTITFTKAGASFNPLYSFRPIKIVGSTTPGNNGVFEAFYVSPTQLSWENAAGATEAFPGAWEVFESYLDDGVDPVVISSGNVLLKADINNSWNTLKSA